MPIDPLNADNFDHSSTSYRMINQTILIEAEQITTDGKICEPRGVESHKEPYREEPVVNMEPDLDRLSECK